MKNLLPLLTLCLALVSAPGFITAQQPKDIPPEEARIRAVSDLKLSFPTYILDAATFPEIKFEDPAQAEKLLGKYKLTTTRYNPARQPVTTADKPGIYGAVVLITPETGQPFRRFFTLFRLAEKVEAGTGVTLESLAQKTSIPLDILQSQSDLLDKEGKSRPLDQIRTDPRMARLLAGLSLSPKATPPVPKNLDAFAHERQWWVTLRLKLNGHEANPFTCPQPIDGNPAPVVRAGTLAEAGFKPGSADKIDAVLQKWAADDDQAFAVCIVRHGVIVLHQAYGTRDDKPMTVDTKSWMASITKTMSASCMMMLVDQGLVSLDDPVEKYLPAFRGIKVKTPMTIRHLYTHTAGLNVWPAAWYNDEQSDVAERIALAYPHLHVGQEWGYNGQSYTLAGKIIEEVTGEAMPLFYHRHLFGPLGCQHTDVTGTHADAFSTPLDMAKFAQMLLNKGAYGTLRFFREETFAQMLPGPLTKVLGPDAKRTFGIGLDGTPDRIGHGAASAATFRIDRKLDLIVIMTRNKMGKNQEKYNGAFVKAIEDGME